MSRFWKREVQIQQLVLSHLSFVEQAMKHFVGATRAYFVDRDPAEAERLMHETHKAESKADDVRFDVERALVRGALLAASRRQILQMIDRVDTLANAAQATLHCLLGQSVEVPLAIYPFVLKILEETESLFGVIACGIQSLLSGKNAEVLDCAAQIDAHESTIDRLQRDAVKELFALEIELAKKLHVLRYLEALVDISDRGEDLADQMALVAAERAF